MKKNRTKRYVILEENVQQKVFYIKSLQLDIELLADIESDRIVSAKLKKLAEKVRFSDPISCPELELIEKEIVDKINRLKNAEDKSRLLVEIDALITERNEKVKILK